MTLTVKDIIEKLSQYEPDEQVLVETETETATIIRIERDPFDLITIYGTVIQ